MKKIIFIFLLFANSAYTQGFTSVDASYGLLLYKNPFNTFNSLGNYKSDSPIQIAGIALNAEVPLDGNPDTYILSYISYSRVLPTAVTVQDTISCKVGGSAVNLSYLAFSLWGKTKIFHMAVGGAIGTGRLTLTADDLLHQKNAWLSPGILIQPRLRLGRIALSVQARYGWDISKPSWKKIRNSNNNQPALDTFKQSGLTAFVSLGYIIAHY